MPRLSDTLAALPLSEANQLKERKLSCFVRQRTEATPNDAIIMNRDGGLRMTKESELDFLLRRAAQELDYADLCRDPAVAAIHREMALMYAKRIADCGKRSPRASGTSPPPAMPQSSTSVP